MKRTLTVTVGVLLLVVGAIWTFQGLGVIKGGGMSGVETWAVIGPIVAGLGVALAIVGARGGPRP